MLYNIINLLMLPSFEKLKNLVIHTYPNNKEVIEVNQLYQY
jgi:hypothetical protein